MSMLTTFNHARFDPQSRAGHYESYFQRANHPTEPRALWIRYTVFCPQGSPQQAEGELWFVYFDGVAGQQFVAKQNFGADVTIFDRQRFGVRIGGAILQEGALRGTATSSEGTAHWDLRYSGGQSPLLFLPERLYSTGFPKAKSLVGSPMCRYSGEIDCGGTRVSIDNWLGSQNHNWGQRHTDAYAWGQVAGFDDQPDWFLELATARVRLGPIWSPWFTPIVLRTPQGEYALNTLGQSVRAHGAFEFFNWQFASENRDVAIRGRIWAEPGDFVALTYRNPPGGVRHCLNSKLSRCEITLGYKSGSRAGQTETAHTASRAAFEILAQPTDPHGIALRVH